MSKSTARNTENATTVEVKETVMQQKPAAAAVQTAHAPDADVAAMRAEMEVLRRQLAEATARAAQPQPVGRTPEQQAAIDKAREEKEARERTEAAAKAKAEAATVTERQMRAISAVADILFPQEEGDGKPGWIRRAAALLLQITLAAATVWAISTLSLFIMTAILTFTGSMILFYFFGLISAVITIYATVKVALSTGSYIMQGKIDEHWGVVKGWFSNGKKKAAAKLASATAPAPTAPAAQ